MEEIDGRVGYSEVLPITIMKNKDGKKQAFNIELQIEDLQNEGNFTEMHQFQG